mgnify:CR=1 FL=1
MDAGVTFADPARVDIRGQLICGKDVFIDVNVVFEGDVTLGDGVRIGMNNLLRNSNIGDGTVVRAHCHIEESGTGRHCIIGPYARLRPDTDIAENVRVGNFVEIKNSRIADRSKVNHLTYLGDAIIGQDVNVGAGTITCNYDGANKHKTEIKDGAFIGSNSSLVAPIKIGKKALVGAGSVLTKNVKNKSLALTRVNQLEIKNYKKK